MRSGRINTLPTSQDAPAQVYHARHKHEAGTGSVVTSVKLPKTTHVDGSRLKPTSSASHQTNRFIVSVSDQTKYGFTVTLTSRNGGALAEGSFTVLVVG
jgi:hypothetical protein